MRKLPITRVGEVVKAVEGNGVYVNHWGFSSPELAGTDAEFDVTPEPEGMAGWTLPELHAIAHGYPCGCGIAELGG